MGDRYDNLKAAYQLINNHEAIKVVNTSSIYETDPVGYTNQDLFLNMVIQVKTGLNSDQLLDLCLHTEQLIGRKRDIKWGPRTLDLDILLYNEENIETEKLLIPHPRMHERAFVIIPLLEINKNITIPMFDKPLEAFLPEINDKEGVRIWKQKNGEDVFALTEN